MALFDFHEKPTGNYTSTAGLTAKQADAVCLMCKEPATLQQIPIELHRHEDVLFWSNGSWSMKDLAKVLVGWMGRCELWLSTYSVTEFSMRTILLLQQEGLLSSVNMLLDYKAKVRYPAVFQLAENTANQVATTQVHAKLTVFKSDERVVFALTSCNWTENERIEAGFITRHPATAQFYLNQIQQTITHANTFDTTR